MIELETALAGSDLYAARFGESIANLGDIDNDGFEGRSTSFSLKVMGKEGRVVVVDSVVRIILRQQVAIEPNLQENNLF